MVARPQHAGAEPERAETSRPRQCRLQARGRFPRQLQPRGGDRILRQPQPEGAGGDVEPTLRRRNRRPMPHFCRHRGFPLPMETWVAFGAGRVDADAGGEEIVPDVSIIWAA